jgi:hypothetical protein
MMAHFGRQRQTTNNASSSCGNYTGINLWSALTSQRFGRSRSVATMVRQSSVGLRRQAAEY